jgi:hypothetical protein
MRSAGALGATDGPTEASGGRVIRGAGVTTTALAAGLVDGSGSAVTGIV